MIATLVESVRRSRCSEFGELVANRGDRGAWSCALNWRSIQARTAFSVSRTESPRRITVSSMAICSTAEGRPKQRACMTLGDLASVERGLDAIGQEQQAKCVGDRDAGAADSIRDIGLGEAEFVDQLAVGHRFLERRQVGPDDVFDQRQLELGLQGNIHDDRWNLVETGELGCAPAPLTRDQRVGIGRSAGLTTIGWMTPCMRIESASTSSSSGSMEVRGCLGFGEMLAIVIAEIEVAGAWRFQTRNERFETAAESGAARCLPGRALGVLAVRSFTVAGCSSSGSSVNQPIGQRTASENCSIRERILRCWKWTGPNEPPVVHRAGMSTLSFFLPGNAVHRRHAGRSSYWSHMEWPIGSVAQRAIDRP